MGVNDYGAAASPLDAPPLGGPGGWAESVSAALNDSDETVDARIAAHSADSTDVHGIPDTADLTTTAELEAYAAARATVGNLLTDNQASGTDTLGTVPLSSDEPAFYVIGGTGASSTTYAREGSRSLQITCTGGNAGPNCGTNAGGIPADVERRIQATPGVPITGMVSLLAPASTRQVNCIHYWYNAAGATLATPQALNLAAASGSWQDFSVTAVAPADTAYVGVRWYISTPAVGEVYYFDRLSVHAGAGGQFSMPGTPITGLGTRITRPNVDDRLVEQWNGSAWSVVDYDSGWRDISTVLTADVAPIAGSGFALLRRQGSEVTVALRVELTADAAGIGSYRSSAVTLITTLPAGFGMYPGYVTHGPFTHSAGVPVGSLDNLGSANRLTCSIPGAAATVGDWVPGDDVRGTAQWLTNNSVPTSLPGTLVSPAPE